MTPLRSNEMPPLWTCRTCGRSFANRNQTHTCAPLDLERHFKDRSPELRALFDAFVAALDMLGPVTILPEKTRIAFHVRMSFAQLTPRKRFFVGHLVLARETPSSLFTRIETFSPKNHVHHFKLSNIAQIDDPMFRACLAEAYAVGKQEHLRPNAHNAD